mmetsp:Transcript_26053/g.65659  ORF Transcript_26053/g.65659 Transcript_26053/m.65659 type:complete len:201 (-) Transcript_26053:2640-3242(-)
MKSSTNHDANSALRKSISEFGSIKSSSVSVIFSYAPSIPSIPCASRLPLTANSRSTVSTLTRSSEKNGFMLMRNFSSGLTTPSTPEDRSPSFMARENGSARRTWIATTRKISRESRMPFEVKARAGVKREMCDRRRTVEYGLDIGPSTDSEETAGANVAARAGRCEEDGADGFVPTSKPLLAACEAALEDAEEEVAAGLA